jgi:hypothetical protein
LIVAGGTYSGGVYGRIPLGKLLSKSLKKLMLLNCEIIGDYLYSDTLEYLVITNNIHPKPRNSIIELRGNIVNTLKYCNSSEFDIDPSPVTVSTTMENYPRYFDTYIPFKINSAINKL